MASGSTPVTTPPGQASGPPAQPGAPRRWSLFQVLLAGVALVAVLITLRAFLYGARLSVRTAPPGATVFVNGRVAGATPVVLRGVGPGNYCLRLEKEGFVSAVRQLKVPREGLAVEETLTPNGAGSLLVQIKPRGAEVLLDGELLGNTPLQRLGVPAGVHDLVVRKTNHKPYIQRIEVRPGELLEFKDFGLEDMILTMLRAGVEREKQSVRNYMDLGHYLFVNDELDEAAEIYARAEQVAATPLVFAADTRAEERALEQRLRAEDVDRLHNEIKRKTTWPGKDVTKFAAVVKHQQELAVGKNVADWPTVRAAVQNLVQDQKYERAEALLQQHIAAAPNTPLLAQAYIELLQVRLRMHKLDGVRETQTRFNELYGGQAVYLRQAANAVYSSAKGYQGAARAEVLGIAEQMLRAGVLHTKPGRGEPELHALCKFELANVLCLQGRPEQGVLFYREAIAGTKDESTRELRSLNFVECLKTVHNLGEARATLAKLSASPREEIAKRAKDELRQLMPSPDNK